MRTLLLLTIAALLTFSLGCRSGAAVQNMHGSTATAVSAKNLTTEDVRKAIVSACTFRGWQAREVSPGLIEARLLVRGKHTVVVDIPYSASEFSIKYKSSSNMEYKAAAHTIHPNYNKWVGLLYTDINGQLARITH